MTLNPITSLKKWILEMVVKFFPGLVLTIGAGYDALTYVTMKMVTVVVGILTIYVAKMYNMAVGAWTMKSALITVFEFISPAITFIDKFIHVALFIDIAFNMLLINYSFKLVMFVVNIFLPWVFKTTMAASS